MLLRSIVEDIEPLGCNMWDQVVLRYNVRRPRGMKLKAGSSDYNDGLDEGEDDEELLLHVGGVCDENQSRALKRTVYEVEETAIHDGSLVPA
ncbi:hypothetical protein F441_22204 [Phytophthora nicotianae CJ01A1]|uniref:Uncharacterized protein n=3 Tax=Phytophthora nicotianae TaxID=4792 RepID=V9DVC2_PHYNI|nr:hypothetical protein F443_22298 [Phytophthora nicotianae P1569]ETL77658.1 hypothetical protein L917_21412 [Phytophthora nicotianae]ETP00380.1 hypothetical protein F441_22204 [Phytophthora nicotianae CJ01A1]